jgi:hypothetical protein
MRLPPPPDEAETRAEVIERAEMLRSWTALMMSLSAVNTHFYVQTFARIVSTCTTCEQDGLSFDALPLFRLGEFEVTVCRVGFGSPTPGF